MYSLILLRHAKSNFTDMAQNDAKRPLSKRGELNAAQMGNLLKDRELFPQIILSSTALRATQTVDIVSKTICFSGEICLYESLYMAEAEDIIKLLRTLPDELERVMVIGHNPGLESLIPILTGHIESLPTAGVAYLTLPIMHWQELKPKT
jgi:phosphohistidine phosphatase